MKLMKLLVSVILVVYFISSIGCVKKASEEIDPGTFDDSVYSNKYFGMSITLPPDWHIQDKEAMEMIRNAGRKIMEGSNKNLKSALDASKYQTVHLFALFKHPLGTPVPYNPNLMCIVERISHVPGIKRGKDYQLHTKRLMQSSQMNVKFPEEIYSETFGGIEFDVLTIEMKLFDMLIKQKQYTIIRKGYALMFATSFTTEDQEAELKEALETVTFD